MLPTPHPEVLAEEWLPPVVLGRESEVREIVRRLDPPEPTAPPPWVVGVVGPRGCGSSSVARRAAREVADRVRTARVGPVPRVILLRTARCRGLHGIASALLRTTDEGFDGRGFPAPEILAGFLRRLRRDGRPSVLVLDDVHTGGPDLGPVLRAIGEPDRFLPEGESGLPPLWTIVAGTPECVARAERALGDRWSFGPYVRIEPYEPRLLRALVVDRAERALGRAAPSELIERTVERAIVEGGGAARAIDLLRRGLLAPPFRTRGSIGRSDLALAIEPRVVQAIEEAAHGSAARLGEVRRSEARLARQQGASPLPPTTLWRRLVRLEQAGYVRREVRPGGEGGTRSILRVIAPVDEWVIARAPPETRPASAAWDAPGLAERWASAAGARSSPAPPSSDDEAG